MSNHTQVANELASFLKPSHPDQLPPLPTQLLLQVDLRVTLVTPMVGGGVQVGFIDEKSPIRTESIRGQLKFWWRLLASVGAIHTPSDGQRANDPERLRQLEARVWGGVHEGDEGPVASCIGVLVGGCSGEPMHFDDLKHLPGIKYILFSIKDNHSPGGHPLWRAGGEFNLNLQLRRAPDGHAPISPGDLATLVRHWVVYGGVGARTRRGFGALDAAVTSFHGDEDLKQLWGAVGSRLAAPDPLPDLPVFVAKGISSGPSDALPALEAGLKKLHTFRQGIGIGRNAGDKKNNSGKPLPGMSLWPEPHGLRIAQGQFYTDGEHPGHSNKPKNKTDWDQVLHTAPRLAFGAPMGVEFIGKDGGTLRDGEWALRKEDLDPSKGSWLPLDRNGNTAERMSSPFILKPVLRRSKEGKFCWVPALILLPIQAMEPGSPFLDDWGRLLQAKWMPQNTRRGKAVVKQVLREVPTLPLSTAKAQAPWPLWPLSLSLPQPSQLPYPQPHSAVESFINFFVTDPDKAKA